MTTTDPQNEIFPSVDENDNVIGEVKRHIAHKHPDIIHRAVGILIFNQKGELLIQKRSLTKDTFPGCWEHSVGGHVDKNDNYLNTAVRELEEEVGLKVDPQELENLGKMLLKMPSESEYWTMYKLTTTYTDFKINKEEITEVKFLSLDDLKLALKDDNYLWNDKFSSSNTFLRSITSRYCTWRWSYFSFYQY